MWGNIFWGTMGVLAAAIIWHLIILPIYNAIPPRGGFIRPRRTLGGFCERYDKAIKKGEEHLAEETRKYGG